MKAMFRIISTAVVAFAYGPVHAQNAIDEASIRAIAAHFEESWNRHDMSSLANSFTEDADFVNVGAKHWKGRKEIAEQHAARLGQFIDSSWTTNAVTTQFLKADVALVHIAWSLRGDKDPDGIIRLPREGLFTWLVIKRGGEWLIRAAQNTNASNLPPPVAPKG